MAATITKLETQRPASGKADGPTVRAAIDAFLDSPKIKRNPNTARAYTGVLDRIAGVIGAGRELAGGPTARSPTPSPSCGARQRGDVEPQPRRGRLLARLVSPASSAGPRPPAGLGGIHRIRKIGLTRFGPQWPDLPCEPQVGAVAVRRIQLDRARMQARLSSRLPALRRHLTPKPQWC